MKKISASDLYSYIECPHRVWRDTFDDPSLKDSPNEFVQLLWEKGVAYEKDVIEKQSGDIEILDLSDVESDKRFEKTLDAMRSKVPYIYQGRLDVEELVGKPDLLELQSSGEYFPIDIKSGMGYERDESEDGDAKLKKTYAVQIGLYVDALIRLGFLKTNIGKILDSRGQIVEYDLNQSQGVKNKQTWWEYYLNILGETRKLFQQNIITSPALSSKCKLCEWYSDCKKTCVENNCVTLIPELGRSKKESFRQIVSNVKGLSEMTLEDFSNAKKELGIRGIAEKGFERFNRRAKLQVSKSKEPIILGEFSLLDKSIELFFDIETDPTQDLVYLHGVVERQKGASDTKFHYFVADNVSKEAEKQAWADFWKYIRSLPENDWVMYYYSKYERTQYRILAQRYPDVATSSEVEWLFQTERAIDLYYDIVKKYTEWPTYNYSVKAIAQHLGFEWRDINPSGAASIQWFNEWQKDRNHDKLQRILDYNEDDCQAMVIIKDSLYEKLCEC